MRRSVAVAVGGAAVVMAMVAEWEPVAVVVRARRGDVY
jgi:hypothetical protein